MCTIYFVYCKKCILYTIYIVYKVYCIQYIIYNIVYNVYYKPYMYRCVLVLPLAKYNVYAPTNHNILSVYFLLNKMP